MTWKKIHEELNVGTGDHTHRLKIDGGYLYRNIFLTQAKSYVNVVFVPDRDIDDILADSIMNRTLP